MAQIAYYVWWGARAAPLPGGLALVRSDSRPLRATAWILRRLPATSINVWAGELRAARAFVDPLCFEIEAPAGQVKCVIRFREQSLSVAPPGRDGLRWGPCIWDLGAGRLASAAAEVYRPREAPPGDMLDSGAPPYTS